MMGRKDAEPKVPVACCQLCQRARALHTHLHHGHMASWKRFTGAVDLSAQSFLKNKKFSREKKTFSWDWHAWNLVLVTTPSLLLGLYLHRVEKRMLEEARVREEIQERTGVSSRGFLVPQREVREEVQGMLSAGNQRVMVGNKDADGAARTLRTTRVTPTEGSRGRNEREGNTGTTSSAGVKKDAAGALLLSSDIRTLQRRLDAIERMLKLEGDFSSGNVGVDDRSGTTKDPNPEKSDIDTGEGKVDINANDTTSKGGVLGGDTAVPGMSVDKAIGMASAAGRWAVEVGGREGKRFLQIGRDWLGGENRQDTSQSQGAGTRLEGGVEQKPSETNGERVPAEERPTNSTRDSGTGQGSASVGNDSDDNEGEEWRRGSSDKNKQR